MTTAVRCTLGIAAAVLLVPASAGARPWMTPSGSYASPVHTDGSRYAVVQRHGGVTRIRDTRKGTSFTFRPPAGYTLVGTGGGQVAWQCAADCAGNTSEVEPLVLTIATRRVTRLPRLTAEPGESLAFQRVGKHWLYGERTGYHYQAPVWYAWHARPARRSGVERDDRHAMDLDRAGLGPRLCEPLRRAGPFEGPDPAVEWHQDFVDYSYERPFGLWRTNDGDLMLDRCGSPISTRIGHVLPYERRTGEQLGARLVTWFHHGEAHAHAVRSGRRQAWPAPSKVSVVQHTRTRIFISSFDNGTWAVATAKIPKRLRD